MKKLLLTLLLAGVATYVQAQGKIDTLYYTKDWKQAPNKAFASFYRIAYYPADSAEAKQYRDYYATGELQGSGYFLSLNASDDSKSVFDGECTNYFKNGKPESISNYKDGKLNGTCFLYKENGLIKSTGTYYQGQRSGIHTHFNDDGTFVQIEYMSDKPVLDYYVKGDQHGNLIKLRIADNSPVWETPAITERKVDYKDGTAWQYYHKNGLSIALTNSVVNDYGKWHKINVVIANNSMLPIEFNPTANITASSNDVEGLTTYLEVWSSEEYIRKVNRAQTFAAVMMGISEGMAAANAGYSTSTTRSYHYGNIYSHGSRTHSYAGSSASRRVTYNAYAAYQANVLASARMADFCYTLEQEQKIKELGYLKTNTIYPGESVSGYVHIKRAKGETVQFIIDIHGAKYTFDWRLGKKRSCIPSEATTTESIKNYIQSPTIQSLIDSNITRLSSLQIDKVLTTYTALGDSYLNASGDENLKRAFLCYYLGAKQNEPEAFYILATYYETGFNQGDFKIKSDLKLAGFLYATAAKLGVAGAREKANSLR